MAEIPVGMLRIVDENFKKRLLQQTSDKISGGRINVARMGKGSGRQAWAWAVFFGWTNELGLGLATCVGDYSSFSIEKAVIIFITKEYLWESVRAEVVFLTEHYPQTLGNVGYTVLDLIGMRVVE